MNFLNGTMMLVTDFKHTKLLPVPSKTMRETEINTIQYARSHCLLFQNKPHTAQGLFLKFKPSNNALWLGQVIREMLKDLFVRTENTRQLPSLNKSCIDKIVVKSTSGRSFITFLLLLYVNLIKHIQCLFYQNKLINYFFPMYRSWCLPCFLRGKRRRWSSWLVERLSSRRAWSWLPNPCKCPGNFFHLWW